jgi:hypothetical protein
MGKALLLQQKPSSSSSSRLKINYRERNREKAEARRIGAPPPPWFQMSKLIKNSANLTIVFVGVLF